MIRTIHHLSCTGGTLLSRYVATLDGVVLLSEVNPGALTAHEFAPFDPVKLMAQASDILSAEMLEEEQRRRYALCFEAAARAGRTLVLRDHAHSDFLAGPVRPGRLRGFLIRHFDGDVRALVTVRNPIDSFLGMVAAKWDRHVRSFQTYCRRYNAFLDHYDGCPVVKYEDFVRDPEATGAAIARALALASSRDFETLFTKRLTGHSGRARRAGTLKTLRRRPIPEWLRPSFAATPAVRTLFGRLDYPFDP